MASPRAVKSRMSTKSTAAAVGYRRAVDPDHRPRGDPRDSARNIATASPRDPHG
jgi:hypothetical protein